MANLNIAIQIAARDNASGPIGRITNSLSGLKDRGLSGLQAAGQLAFGGIVAGAGLAVGAVGVIGTAAFGVANDVQTATGEIQAALGATTEESERLADIAKNVWGNNFAGSISEAAGAIGLVRQQLGDLSDNELQTAAENSFRLADNFGIEVPESIDAANTLMEQFGLTSDEAFDFIASGFQRGLNRGDDFLDTIGEYSTQFASGGADAGQFFSLLESGLQGGMLGTDKAADAFKEFRVRIQDGSSLTAESLEMIGLSSDEMAEQMADGTLTAADAFTMVVDALGEVDDENVRIQAGVGLLGTQFEDLGTAGALGLSLVGTEMEDLAGSTETLDAKYGNLGSAVEGYKRRALVALEPIGNALLGLANDAMPLVDSAFAFFETSIVPAIETAAGVVQGFLANLEEGMTPMDAFIEAIWDIAPPEVLAFLVDLRDNIFPAISAWFTNNVQPVLAMVAGFVGWQDVLAAVGVVVASVVLPALAGILAAAAPVIAVGALLVGAIALVRTAWENDWGGIQGKVQTAVTFIQNIITTVMTGIQTFWDAHGQTILTAAETVWEAIKTAIDTALSVLKSVFDAFKSAFEGDWTAFGENLRAAADTAWEYIKTTFSNAGANILSWLSGFILDMIAKFGDTDWTQLAQNVIDGLISGLAAGATAVVNKMREIGQAAYDAWNGFWNSNSPSKLAMEGASYVTDGFLAQWGKDENVLARASASLGQSAYDGLFGNGLALPSGAGAGAPRLATAGGGGGTTVIFQAGAINAQGATPGVEARIKTEIERFFAQKGQQADIRIRGR